MIIRGIMANGTFFVPQSALLCDRMAVSDITGEKHGILNSNGDLVGELKYRKVVWFNSKAAGCQVDDKHFVLMDQQGQEIPELFEAVEEVCEHYALGKKAGKWRFVNTKTHSVGKTAFDKLFFYKKGSGAILSCGAYYTAIDEEGRLLAPPIYDEVSHMGDGKFSMRLHGKYGVLCSKGVLVPPILDTVGLFYCGRAIGSKDGKSVIIKEDGWE